MLTGVFAGGALLIKYKLESVRTAVLEAAESRTGVHLEAGAVTLTGLQGIRIDELHLAVETEEGPSASVYVPNAYVSIDLLDLLYGEIDVERLQLDGAVIRLERPAGHSWLLPKDLPFVGGGASGKAGGFRILGRECSLEIINIVRNTHMTLSSLDFDVFRLQESANVVAEAKGYLNGDREKRLDASVFFTSLHEFEVRAECSRIATEDVDLFLPATQRFVESGVVHPRARVVGYPDRRMMVWVDGSFEDLAVRDHPPFLKPFTGSVSVLADYDVAQHEFTIITSKAESQEAGGGKLEGTVAFRNETPSFDLRLALTRLPIEEILDHAIEGRVAEYGALEMSLSEPYEVALTLKGDIENPKLGARVNAAAGSLSFTPKNKSHVDAQLKFTSVEADWDSAGAKGGASFNIVEGEVGHPDTGLRVKHMTGRLSVKDKLLRIEPLNAEIHGQPLVGSLSYDLEESAGKASLSGTVARLEDMPFSSRMKDLALSGSVTFQGNVDIKPGRYVANVDVEATQTEINYRWFLHKPIGLGVSGKVALDLAPRKRLELSADIASSGTNLTTKLQATYGGGKWRLQKSDTVAEQVDVGFASNCLTIPYTATGGLIKQARYEWTREAVDPPMWNSRLTSSFDEIRLLHGEIDQPHVFKDGVVELVLKKGAEKTGVLKVKVASAELTPFGTKWFVPMRCPPELADRFPPTPCAWTYDLAADEIALPPWRGANFKGDGYFNAVESGFRSYSGNVDNGHIKGMYRLDRRENAYETSAQWENIPATYLLKHLKYPEMLTGDVTGEVAYSVDRDDVDNTLKGKGAFTVLNGQFSADYVFSQLEQRTDGQMDVLPPSLRFSELSTDVVFHKRRVKTDNLQLKAEGLKLSGEGQYVREGDMDYEINVAVSPDMAEKIAVLKDNFNVRGHRLAGEDIELKFHVKGPTLRPTSELAEIPPRSVTLMTGALQATSDAMKVIDIPRKILVDMLKTGAGIMAPRKAPSDNEK